ncbi:MAG: L,D-transpeptidase family protein [Planctomycetota bacterium]|jgi:LysM repeat protein
MSPRRLYGERVNGKGKWIIALVILAFVAFKIYKSDVGPTFIVADESELGISTVEPDMEDSALSTTSHGVSEPNVPQITGSSRQSNPGSAVPVDDVLADIDLDGPGVIEARDKLNAMLSTTVSEEQSSSVKRQLSALSEKWLFGRAVFPDDQLCGRYLVEPGDSLEALGRKFRIPYHLIMRINNISDPRALRAGDTIKVINGPFRCKVYRSAFTMDLYLQDTFVRNFTVGLGKPGRETPTGRWKVKGKLLSPTWTDPDTGKTYEAEDPDYPLGARWIALEGLDGDAKGRTGFAIHGTRKPEQLGTAESRGCIRLYNGDVKLVYDLLRAGVSEVVVVE